MNGGKKPLGYTIVEVMIVLAVSGMMFAIAASFINGKQANTAFTQGANELGSKIQLVIGQVTDGQYSDAAISCTHTTGSTVVSAGLSGDQQGANSKCVFLGKLLHFSVNSEPDKFNVYSVAGGRANDDNQAELTFADSVPTIIAPLTSEYTTPQSLEVTQVTATDTTGVVLAGDFMFGFLQGLGSKDKTGALSNGSQAISLYAVKSVGSSIDKPTAYAKVLKTQLFAASKVQICLSDGSRHAIISLGNDDVTGQNVNSQLNVDTKIYGTAPTPAGLC